METVHFLIHGRVQGVGFRRYVAACAQKNMLSGWVRNTQDGCVEVYAVGNAQNIVSLISTCQTGPVFASVSELTFMDNKTMIPPFGQDQSIISFQILR